VVVSFESPWVLWCGFPALLGLIGWTYRRFHAVRPGQTGILLGLRAAALGLLILLAARPIWSSSPPTAPPRDRIVLLVDDSESMSLDDGGRTSRYAQAVAFARDRLLPAIERAGLRAEGMVFSEGARLASGAEIAGGTPTGKETNLAGAVVSAITSTDRAPLAVIALTDGIATRTSDNHLAGTALLEDGVPLIGIGVGDDQGSRVITPRSVHAPRRVPPNTEFRVEFEARAAGEGLFPPVELILFRDGALLDRKRIPAFRDARWIRESFKVKETSAGRHTYAVRMLADARQDVRIIEHQASTLVTISDEAEWRILFVQGGLTWDYKFIQLALRGDPAIRIAGFSRTSNESRFFQSASIDGEQAPGLPETLERFADYRVVVLANIRPSDLPIHHQKLLVRYCAEQGGSVLMVGGGETFHAAWRDSPLEELLPVRFPSRPAPSVSEPFTIQPTDAALGNPVFQIGGSGNPRDAWNRLPPFHAFAEIERLKPGAQVWAEQGGSRSDRRPLIVAQPFGAGRTAAILVPNLWRWRLARDSDPSQFDRFWRQLLRYLGGGDPRAVDMQFVDPWLSPDTDLRVVLNRRKSPKETEGAVETVRFVVADSAANVISEQPVELAADRPAEIVFRVSSDGLFTLRVQDAQRIEVGSRTVDIRKTDREFARTGRDLEHLRQWARLSRGEAIAIEECDDVGALVEAARGRAADAYVRRPVQKPAGVDPWTMAALVAVLAAEWTLRRRWDWT